MIHEPIAGLVFNVQVFDKDWHEKLHRRLFCCGPEQVVEEVKRWIAEEWRARKHRDDEVTDTIPTTTMTLEAFHVA